MKQIQFAQTYNNEAAHRQVKLLMKQHKQLYIQVNGEAWISSQGVTSIRYNEYKIPTQRTRLAVDS